MAKSRYKVVITGATGGIGRELVKVIQPFCEYIILVGLAKQELLNLKAELRFNNLHILEVDVTQASARQELKELVTSLGGLNLLINNAGVSDFNLIEDQSEETIERILQVNLLSPMLLTQTLLPLLKAEKTSAEIINTGSIFGYIGYPGFTAYSASKFGLRGFSEAMNRELGDTNVKVRYFAPRAAKTAFNDDKTVQMNKALGNAMDEPKEVAKKFLKFLFQSKFQKKIGLKESFFVFVNQLFPSIPSKAIIKQLPIIKKYLAK